MAEQSDDYINESKLSPTQKEMLSMISRFIELNGFAPSMKDIGAEVGLNSLSSVTYQLGRLEIAGFIRRDPGKSRALELTNKVEQLGLNRNDRPITAIPLVGRIAAGIPITAEQQIEEIYDLPTEFVGSGKLFMLQVVGDSMIDAAICDGDFVVIRQQPSAENGEIVAAMIDGEATVKVFRHSDGHTWLIPRNSSFEPILADHSEILGKVVTVLRRT